MTEAVYAARLSEAFLPAALAELALDLRWSFNHSADAVWQRLNPEVWELTHNAWFVLQTVSRDRLQAVTAADDFQTLLGEVIREKRDVEGADAWFQHTHPHSALTAIAYFSLEFMLSEALPIYSGGLGNVAGDYLKTASNLGVPVVGIGLLYQQGYFRQQIDARGRQQEAYPFNDPGQLPITELRQPNGEWLRLAIPLPGAPLWVRCWEVKVGRARLYLLDTNDPANSPVCRGITSGLYGGSPELRLKQELVLGVAGWRLLRALGIRPEVAHLNEGHAAFAILERARCHMIDLQQPFDVALMATRPGNVFTTHTPVDAGFDRFDRDLIAQYLTAYAENELCIPLDSLLALGRRNASDLTEPFNMAYLAIRGSGAVNGVSRLHGEVSRRIFEVLFPRWPQIEIPIGYVTNGVHMPTWDSAEADRLWERMCGKDRWRWTLDDVERGFSSVDDAALWQLRTDSRRNLVGQVRARLKRQFADEGATAQAIVVADTTLTGDALTIGFARRFATYKRPDLLLHDPDRLVRLLTDRMHPVQLIVAGKAHPNDGAGKAMIERWMAFVRRPDVRPRAVFLGDYDVLLGEQLVRGVDLWINTPRRPWEACGTSGMKVLVNGGLNLSELDGWWAEAYSPEVGWAIGDGREHGDDPSWDAAEADALYALLEREVIPAFYTRDERGIPPGWVSRMRESMTHLTPRFSANRMVREYTDDLYVSAAIAYRERLADGGRLAADLLKWRSQIESCWPRLKMRGITGRTEADRHVFEVRVFLDDLADSVRVELYADPPDGGGPIRQPMTCVERMPDRAFLYRGEVPATRPVTDYTPRVVPYHPAAVVPLEAPFILWGDRS